MRLSHNNFLSCSKMPLCHDENRGCARKHVCRTHTEIHEVILMYILTDHEVWRYFGQGWTIS